MVCVVLFEGESLGKEVCLGDATIFVGECDGKYVSAPLGVMVGGVYCVHAEEGKSLGKEVCEGVVTTFVGEWDGASVRAAIGVTVGSV